MIDEIGGPEAAKVLFRGKIVAVERRLFKVKFWQDANSVRVGGDCSELTTEGSE